MKPLELENIPTASLTQRVNQHFERFAIYEALKIINDFGLNWEKRVSISVLYHEVVANPQDLCVPTHRFIISGGHIGFPNLHCHFNFHCVEWFLDRQSYRLNYLLDIGKYVNRSWRLIANLILTYKSECFPASPAKRIPVANRERQLQVQLRRDIDEIGMSPI
ncbi:hypothetical protein FF38_12195 [Lucilia cuprina]|uniref:Uncharacterized protein n=1 Tax=Lucilia cuprina TaxID=7375 RepID=A0A0L0BQZ6_LUCCU|nr:hypothetical protein FF38_12195 [Lucilia cuprina]